MSPEECRNNDDGKRIALNGFYSGWLLKKWKKGLISYCNECLVVCRMRKG